MKKVCCVLVLCVMLTACTGRVEEVDLDDHRDSLVLDDEDSVENDVQDEGSGDRETEIPNDEAINEEAQESKSQVSVILDDAYIQALYDTYYRTAIHTILNGDAFMETSDIDPRWIVDFATVKYIIDHPSEPQEFLPIEALKPYVEHYFGPESMVLSQLATSDYNPETGFIQVNHAWEIQSDQVSWSENGWGIILEHIKRLADGSIRAELNTYYQDGSLEHSWVLVLSPNPDGETYHFASASEAHYYLHDIVIEGDYEWTDLFDGYMDEQYGFSGHMDYLGTIGHYQIYRLLSYGRERTYEIKAFSLMTKSFEYTYNLPVEDSEDHRRWDDHASKALKVMDTEAYGQVIGILTNEAVVLLNEKMEHVASIEIPLWIQGQMVDTVYNPEYEGPALLDAFLGYDIAEDLVHFTYASESGVYLYNSLTGEDTLIQAAYKKPQKNGDTQFLFDPRFVGGDNILAILNGYEMTNGYVLYLREEDQVILCDQGVYLSDIVGIDVQPRIYYSTFEDEAIYSLDLSSGIKTETPAFEPIFAQADPMVGVPLDSLSNGYIYYWESGQPYLIDNKGKLLEANWVSDNIYARPLMGYLDEPDYVVVLQVGSPTAGYENINWHVHLDQ